MGPAGKNKYRGKWFRISETGCIMKGYQEVKMKIRKITAWILAVLLLCAAGCRTEKPQELGRKEPSPWHSHGMKEGYG